MNQPGQDIQNYWVLLSRFTSSKQWDRALETAKEWLSSDPQNTRAHLAAAQALINLKRYPEAEPHLFQLLACQPDNDLAHRFMSIVQFHQGRFKAADESIQKALSLDPNDAYNWYHLAWMRHKQDDLIAAAKYAEKARELAPRDSDIVNLLALCTPKRPGSGLLQLQQYQEALELDSENPQVHNNLGVYYLNTSEDFGKAEECFRRALFFDPTLKMARSNLFITIKHRDIVYRILCAPKDLIVKAFALARRNRVLYYALLPVWLIAFRFLFGGLILWFVLVWPTVKVYEYLTIGDIQARAGEVGARRGGFLGYRRWSLRVRLTIFALSLCLFWGAIVGLVNSKSETLGMLWAGLIVAGVLVALGVLVRQKWKQGWFRYRPRHSSKQINRLLKSTHSEH